jgi:protoporphyrinogen/coproporphyrinogen III oxidase
VYALEKAGGSIIAGVIKQIQAKRANPPPPRDARLPPKPAGQTVGSFRKGLQSLPRAIAAKHADNIRSAPCCWISSAVIHFCTVLSWNTD